MRKIILTTLVTIFSLGLGIAQKAKHCTVAEKAACGPGNTKTAEAKVITDLRGELTQLRELLDNSKVKVEDATFTKKDLDKLPLDIQNNQEDAALWFILMEVGNIKRSVSNTSSDSQDYDNKAQLVAALRKDISDLKSTIEAY